MPSLLEVQRQLREVLVGGDVRPPGWIRGPDDTAAERLAVYRNTVATALARALRLNFPTVARLVGDEFFDGMAQVFARQELPAAADLDAYGAGLPAFVQAFEACAGIPYLPDIARLDWAVAKALHAPDVEPLAVDALAGLDNTQAAGLRFAAHPAVSLLASEFPVDEIWRGVLEQDEDAMAAVDLASGPVHLLVERVDDAARVLRVAAPEWRFAAALAAGEPLGQLLSTLAEADVPVLLAQQLIKRRLVAFAIEAPGGITS